MVTVLIDRLPTDWASADVYQLLHPFCPSHVCMAADECGNFLGFAFVFFPDERSANKALIALGLLDMSGRHLYVTRPVAPRLPGEVTG
jgi:RNA recognition motif-containing protein